MKVSDLLAKSQNQLENSGVSNSKLDSLILLTHALSVSKEQIIFNPDLEPTLDQQNKFSELVYRRTKREPISQIIGKREFYGYDFLVTSDVLDPRPDSESLIELVLKKLPLENFAQNNFEFLELGTGSGCLSITLLKLYKAAQATGIDISKSALAICKKNSEILQIQNRLRLLESDLFSNLDQKKFYLIISNPPYIPSEEIEKLEDEVKIFEPHLALDGGIDGLNFYRRIAKQSPNFLQDHGLVIIEIGVNQKEEIIKIFTDENFIFLESKSDLAGIPRALCFKKNI